MNLVAGCRRVLTWKVADGRTAVEARLVAERFQDPDLKNGLVGRKAAHVFDPLILSRSPSVPPTDGNYEGLLSRTPTSKWIPLTGVRASEVVLGGTRMPRSGYGNRGHLRMVLLLHLRSSVLRMLRICPMVWLR